MAQLRNVGGFLSDKGVELAKTDTNVAFAYFEGTQGMLNALKASHEKSVKVLDCVITMTLSRKNQKDLVAFGPEQEEERDSRSRHRASIPARPL